MAMTALFAMLAERIASSHDIRVRLFSGTGGLVLLLGAAGQALCLRLMHGEFSSAALALTLPSIVVSAATDAVSGYVFDVVTVPAIAASFILACCDRELMPAAAGAVAGALPLAIMYAITRGRGLGLGDVKLACCMGAGLGVFSVFAALGVAFVTGGVYAAYLLITKRARRGSALYFAPYLAGSTLLVACLRAAG